jgi:hypothetical protein
MSEREAGMKAQDAFFTGLMTSSMSLEEIERGIDEFEEWMTPEQELLVEKMGELCVAMAEQENLEKEVATAKAKVERLKSLVLNLRTKKVNAEPELSEQTIKDLAAIEKMMEGNRYMVWHTMETFPGQCVLCIHRKISLPRFSAPTERDFIDVNDDMKFVRIQKVPETCAVQRNSEYGRVVVVFKGSMMW